MVGLNMVQKLLNLVLAGCTFTQKWQHSHLVLPEELVMVCLLHSDCKTRPQKLHELFYANIFFSNAFPLFLIQFLGWAVLQSTALSYFGFIGAIHRDWMHLVFSSHFPVNNGMGFFLMTVHYTVYRQQASPRSVVLPFSC